MAGGRDAFKEIESVGVREGPVFTEVLPVEPSLEEKVGGKFVVGAGEEAALGVEFAAPNVAATFGENLIDFLRGVIAPHELTAAAHGGGVGACHDDIGGDGGALSGVEPAVGAPAERVDDGMGVLNPESIEMDFRGAVGHVIAVGVGIEKEVRRIEHPDPAVADYTAGG